MPTKSFFYCCLLFGLLFVAMPARADNDERIARLEDEIQAMQSRAGGGGAANNPLLDQRLDTLEAQVRDLTGQVERANFQNAQLRNQLERMSGDIDLRFDQMRQQPTAAPATAPTVTNPAPAIIDNSSTGDDSDADTGPQAKAAPTGNPKTAQGVYDDAFAKLRAADYNGAATGFTSFLKANPQNALAGNAQYWLGETHYVRGQYKEAAVAFAEGYQKYPKNSKAPDNLLKLAMSLGQLGSKADACLTLGELKKNYPTAAATIKARADQERTKLACKA